jgi:type IV pilus assembly protein PilM
VAVLGGIVPAIVDVDVLALQNAYETNYGVDINRGVVLLDVGTEFLGMSLLAGPKPVVTDALQISHGVAVDATHGLERAMNICAADASIDALTRILLTGVDAELERLADTLRARFDIPVDILDPFRVIEVGDSNGFTLTSRSSAAIAVGLALRQRGDS